MDYFDIVLAVAAVILVALATTWRDLGDGAKRVLAVTGLFGAYAVYCLVAILFAVNIVQSASVDTVRAAAGVAFAVMWMAWGALWLLRYVPAGRNMPATLRQPFGVVGMAVLVAGGAAFAAFAADY